MLGLQVESNLLREAKDILEGENGKPEVLIIEDPVEDAKQKSESQQLQPHPGRKAGGFSLSSEYCNHLWESKILKPPPSWKRVMTSAAWQRYERGNTTLRRTSFSRFSPGGRIAVVRAINLGMEAVIHGKRLSSSKMGRIRKALESKEGREAFVSMMNQGDGKVKSQPLQCLPEKGFKVLRDVTELFLDICMERKDYKKTGEILKVCHVFYTQVKGRRKFLDVDPAVRDHVCWGDLNFWRHSLQLALSEVQEGEKKSVVDGWLSTNMFKMMEFNVDVNDIQLFAEEVNATYELGKSKEGIAHTVHRLGRMQGALKKVLKHTFCCASRETLLIASGPEE
uniref:Uncharacterized protein n=1 Tax=Lotharella globosa TaxID=91324 RepID=A0A7S3Z4Y0_9EUKA